MVAVVGSRQCVQDQNVMEKPHLLPQSAAQLTRWRRQTVMYLKSLTLEMKLPATRTNTDSHPPGAAAAAAGAAH